MDFHWWLCLRRILKQKNYNDLTRSYTDLPDALSDRWKENITTDSFCSAYEVCGGGLNEMDEEGNRVWGLGFSFVLKVSDPYTVGHVNQHMLIWN